MEFANRRSVHDNLRKYCHLAKDNSYIEVSEWINGEGYDITIDNRVISLTMGEIEAITHLVRSIDYNRDKFKQNETI